MSLILEVKVVPSSGQSKIELSKNETIICYVKASPERGKANKELIKLVADFFNIAQYDITIISGLTTTRKRLKVATLLTIQEVKNKLLLE